MSKPPVCSEFLNLTEYISLKEVATLLHVDRATVRRTLAKAGVPTLVFGNCVRYRKADLDSYLAGRLGVASSDASGQ